MEIYVDFNNILQAVQGNPLKVYARLFMKGGWLILLISLIWGFYFVFIYNQKRKYIKSVEYSLFAIDIPKDNEKSTQAIEELFNTLHGIISTKTEWEKKILGRMQLWFGLEIVSIEGYIQFLIRTPSKYNELVKSAIYAQYPDAELTEVEDYMSLIPRDADYPDSKYGGWGMDWYLADPDYLPLKTYLSFEHSLTQSFIDPMASLLEVMSKLAPGEFIGIMMMIQPVKDKQTNIIEQGQKVVDKLMGRETKTKKNLVDKGFDALMKGIDMASETVYSLWGDIEDSQDDKTMLQMLTPGERAKITAIETKCGKIKYRVRMKSCYVAPKKIYSRARGYNGIQGAMKQFDDFNRLKCVKTKAKYFLTKKRKYWKVRRFLRRYTERDFLETKSFILGADELATMYHFPQMDVMAPLIKKAETKTVEPPTGLPLEDKLESELFDDAQKRKEINQKLEDNEIIDLNLDNKYFESKFAKNKDEKNEAQKEFEKDELEKNSKPPTNIPIPNQNKKQKKEIKTSKKDQGKLEPPSNLPFID
jgi:hypothetical protein